MKKSIIKKLKNEWEEGLDVIIWLGLVVFNLFNLYAILKGIIL